MASADSLNDASLRALARKIDPETVAHMGDAELRVRVDTVQGLLDDMSRSTDEYERSRLRLESDRVLNAVSLRAWVAAAAVLNDAVKTAGGTDGATAALKELERFTRDNPQPGLSDPAVLAELTGTNNTPPKRRRFFGRNKL